MIESYGLSIDEYFNGNSSKEPRYKLLSGDLEIYAHSLNEVLAKNTRDRQKRAGNPAL